MITVFVVGVVYWLRNGGSDDLLLLLQPGFRVSAIDLNKGTMTLQGVDEFFTVRCAEACGSFQVGRKYRMLYRGEVLEYKGQNRRLRLPILQQHVKYTVEGGRG